jgi:hypothetical protein
MAESLEEKVKNLEHELDRVKAITECYNLFCKMEYLHMCGRDKDAIGLYSKDPGTRIYWSEIGYWEGSDAAKRNRAIHGERSEAERVGMMPLRAVTSPVIEVAGDGKTAKGVFLGVGFVATKNRETGEPQCSWEIDKYGLDFIKEDGKWKIWHQHIYDVLHGLGWDEKWAEQFKKPKHVMDIPEGLKPDGPTPDSDRNPYRPDTLQRLVPVPPEPYGTWGDVKSY